MQPMTNGMNESLRGYSGKQNEWDRYASIRSKPRRFIDYDLEEEYFPISRQPLCVHPLITSMGKKAVSFILTQSLYKFMYEIAMLETEMVNSAACKVANNRLPYCFSFDIRHDALTVIIDEAYHAFVAVDFMKQVQKKTKIQPIDMPTESPNTLAIKAAHRHLPAELHDSFELIAVCISEHTLTKEMIAIGKESKMLKSFSEVMFDHVQDEGRHAAIFSSILKIFWDSFEEKEKALIGSILPLFLKEYLSTTQQIEFDKRILAALSLPDEKIDKIISDTHMLGEEIDLKNTNPVFKNVVKLLERTGILIHENVKKSFMQEGLL